MDKTKVEPTDLTPEELDTIKRQRFIDKYNELCKEHGLRLVIASEFRVAPIEETK